MRQIVLDTETTGISPNKGHRIVEIGCVELNNRQLTGRHLHYYINPERDIPAEVVAIHGIDNEKVKDAPKFQDIADEFWQFIKGSELIIHNAAFDMGFLDMEHQRLVTAGFNHLESLSNLCTVLDTLLLARKKHPGSKASLDALCKRYGVDNTHRTLHGALLDAEILADVYLLMTGGQTALILDETTPKSKANLSFEMVTKQPKKLHITEPNDTEKTAHQAMLTLIKQVSGRDALWHNTTTELPIDITSAKNDE